MIVKVRDSLGEFFEAWKLPMSLASMEKVDGHMEAVYGKLQEWRLVRLLGKLPTSLLDPVTSIRTMFLIPHRT